ncbi:MAG: hypothetical protein HUK02_03180 [Bacteroidaceae bacterium]|nr:hypothetical protein [Bacteroidaceae bacterium]
MKRLSLLFVALLLTTFARAEGKPGRELASALTSLLRLEEVHPDSVFGAIDHLEARRQQLTSPAERAVYSAALGRLYDERRSQAHYSGIDDYTDRARQCWKEALSDLDLLADTRLTQWGPVVSEGSVAPYYGHDLLHVVWQAWRESGVFTDTLVTYRKVIDCYLRRGNREGALLQTLDSLGTLRQGPSDAALRKLAADYADVPLCALVYLRLSQQPGLTARQQRDVLEEGLRRYPKSDRSCELQNALTLLSFPTFRWEGPSVAYPGKTYTWYLRARNIYKVSIDGKVHTLPEADPYDEVVDSLRWTAPAAPADYPVTFVPQSRSKVEGGIQPLQQTLRVTRLRLLTRSLQSGEAELQVLDAETGRPVPGVDILIYKRQKDTTPFRTVRTDKDGRATTALSSNGSLCLRMRTAEEQHLPKCDTYVYQHWSAVSNDTTSQLRLYTDRAIYRPGQRVEVGGMAYRSHRWEAAVQPGAVVQLQLCNARGETVETTTATTDDMGMLSASFLLPTDGKLGTWTVRASGSVRAYAYFRVEEYKRPTFTVELADTAVLKPTLALVTGVARTVEGLPLRNARVTGTYQYQGLWWRRSLDTELHRLDTLETDRDGRFVVTLPRSDEHYGASVTVDVLSAYGEQQKAERWYRIGETLVRPEPEPRVDSAFVFQCLADTFAVGRPARMRVSTNLKDVTLFYTLTANGAVVKDTALHVSDSTLEMVVPYEESLGTGATAHFFFCKGERFYSTTQYLALAQPDRRLRLHWDTFRNLTQPGAQEEWRLSLRRPDGTPAAAALLLSIYDASLDHFAKHSLQWEPSFPRNYYHLSLSFHEPTPAYSAAAYYSLRLKQCRELTPSCWNADYFAVQRLRGRIGMLKGSMVMAAGAQRDEVYMTAAAANDNYAASAPKARAVAEETAEAEGGNTEPETPEPLAVPLRENFQETAYFAPSLRTDAEGRAVIAFTLPDCITTWCLTGFAHTSDMLSANLRESIVARKQLQAQLRLPRFLRPADQAAVTATVRNLTPDRQQGTATLQVLDARTEKVLLQQRHSFALDGLADTVFRMPYAVGEGDVVVRWVAQGETCTDGEQRLLPVLPALQEVTVSRALTLQTKGVTKYDISQLFPKNTTDRQLAVEYTAHPEQYALNVLPKLAVADGSNVLSLASAYYAGVLAKALDVKIADSTDIYLHRLQALQQADGSFAWYPGMEGNAYLAREVGYLLTRLQMLTGKSAAPAVHQRVARYLLSQIKPPTSKTRHADVAKQLSAWGAALPLLRNLYVIEGARLSYTKTERQKVDSLVHLLRQIEPQSLDLEGQALAALVLQQRGDSHRAEKFVAAFRRLLVSSPERGTYIEHPQGPFSSINRKLHTHVQLMEALQQVQPADTLLRGMRRHLLFEKRTELWNTPVTSANAVFALMNGRTKSAPAPVGDVLTVYARQKALFNVVAPTDSLGHVCDTLRLTTNVPTSLHVHKLQSGESWAAVYAHFLQPYTEVTPDSEGLLVTTECPTTARVGDRVEVKYHIVADRDYEYVTVSLPRPANCEPADVRSGYRWSDGLGLYREVRDARADYHVCRLPRGHYTLTEALYVEQPGVYHTGVPTIVCNYAQEFSGHGTDATLTTE